MKHKLAAIHIECHVLFEWPLKALVRRAILECKIAIKRYSNIAIYWWSNIFLSKDCFCFLKSAKITMNWDFQFTWRKNIAGKMSFYCNIACQNCSCDESQSMAKDKIVLFNLLQNGALQFWCILEVLVRVDKAVWNCHCNSNWKKLR